MTDESESCYYLRLRGLPWQATKEEIRKFLTDVVICEGEESILFTITEEGKRSGDALVLLPTREDVNKAMTYNRKYMGKRYVDIEETDVNEYNYHLKRSTFGSDDCVVRIRGLSYGSTEQEVRNFFNGLKIVENGVSLIRDSENRCMGEAYIEFESVEETRQALNFNRKEMGARFIEVFRSNKQEMTYFSLKKPTPLMSINVSRKQDKYGSDLGGGSHRRDDPSSHMSSRGRDRSPLYESRLDTYSYMEYFVHLRGLPFDCKDEEIVDFFSPLPVVCIVYCYDHSDRFNGECDVHFDNDMNAEQALRYSGQKIGKRYIELFQRKRRVSYLNRNQYGGVYDGNNRMAYNQTAEYYGRYGYSQPCMSENAYRQCYDYGGEMTHTGPISAAQNMVSTSGAYGHMANPYCPPQSYAGSTNVVDPVDTTNPYLTSSSSGNPKYPDSVQNTQSSEYTPETAPNPDVNVEAYYYRYYR